MSWAVGRWISRRHVAIVAVLAVFVIHGLQCMCAVASSHHDSAGASSAPRATAGFAAYHGSVESAALASAVPVGQAPAPDVPAPGAAALMCAFIVAGIVVLLALLIRAAPDSVRQSPAFRQRVSRMVTAAWPRPISHQRALSLLCVART